MFEAALVGVTFPPFLVQLSTTRPPLDGFGVHAPEEEVPSGLCPWEIDGVSLTKGAKLVVLLPPGK